MYEEEFIITMWIAGALALWVLKLKWTNRKLRRQIAAAATAVPVVDAMPPQIAARPPERDAEMDRLRDRVAVLERITVEKESTLSREIESLRHR